MTIKVGYLVAYDYAYLQLSIPTVYDHADTITIALDKSRKTFAGEPFTIDPAFFAWLKEIDKDHKITLYEDHFYLPGMSTRDADVRKRNMLGKFMGDGGWHIQVDADEYFVDFARLVKELRGAEEIYKGRKVSFRVYWYTIFKTLPEGYFFIDDTYEAFALATNHPVYEQNRYNHSIQNVTLNHLVLHQSWGRSEEEMSKKLRNWSHSDDFDTAAYFEFWKSVSISNYKYIRNFHPLFPEYWKKLKFVKASSIEDVIKTLPSTVPVAKKSSFHKIKRWIPPVIFDRMVKNRQPFL
jgi:hypothetical protein